jgi:NTE family protein
MGLITRLGVYRGEVLYLRLRQLLAAKGVARFKDLRSPHAVDPRSQDDPRYRYKVQVIASDVSARRLLILPYHAEALGYDPDELEVALAVRMSASIPFFLAPVRVQRPRLPQAEHVIVDGGLLSNYPIWFFDEQGPPRWPTFGLRLVEGAAAPDTNAGAQEALVRSASAPPAVTNVLDVGASQPTNQIRDLISYSGALVDTMLEAHDRLAVEMDDMVRTIAIPTLGISATDFHLTKAQADVLYESGRHAAERFLASWDFARYVAVYRSGESQQGDSGRGRLEQAGEGAARQPNLNLSVQPKK